MHNKYYEYKIACCPACYIKFSSIFSQKWKRAVLITSQYIDRNDLNNTCCSGVNLSSSKSASPFLWWRRRDHYLTHSRKIWGWIGSGDGVWIAVSPGSSQRFYILLCRFLMRSSLLSHTWRFCHESLSGTSLPTSQTSQKLTPRRSAEERPRPKRLPLWRPPRSRDCKLWKRQKQRESQRPRQQRPIRRLRRKPLRINARKQRRRELRQLKQRRHKRRPQRKPPKRNASKRRQRESRWPRWSRRKTPWRAPNLEPPCHCLVLAAPPRPTFQILKNVTRCSVFV